MRSRLIPGLLVLGLVACGGDDETDATLASGDTLAPQSAGGMDQPPAGMGQTAQMQAVGNSGMGGEVTVTDRGGESEVLVRLTGAPASSSHPGHVHSGTCAAIGQVVQPLTTITTDSTGTGTMTTNVAIAPMTMMNGDHAIVYHGEGGGPAACAVLEHVM